MYLEALSSWQQELTGMFPQPFRRKIYVEVVHVTWLLIFILCVCVWCCLAIHQHACITIVVANVLAVQTVLLAVCKSLCLEPSFK